MTPSARNRGRSAGATNCTWAMWCRLSEGPLADRAAATASRASRTARFADGVHVNLHSVAVEAGDEFGQVRAVPVEDAALVPAEVRRQQGGGLGFQDPVDED